MSKQSKGDLAMLNGMRSMDKTYPIQIQAADMSGVNGYQVYHEQYRGAKTRLIARQVSEDQVEALLNPRDYQRFQNNGAYRFRVSGTKLAEVMQVLI
jgi:hypothetical protein